MGAEQQEVAGGCHGTAQEVDGWPVESTVYGPSTEGENHLRHLQNLQPWAKSDLELVCAGVWLKQLVANLCCVLR